MSRFVDLHAHHLPAIDDGARSVEMGVQMVTKVAALGFSTLHATPHQRAGRYLPSRDEILGAHETLSQALAAIPGAPAVAVAAENFWDEVFLERLRSGDIPCYPGDRAFLFEVDPAMMPPSIESVLFEIRLGGRLPVMAHPERYRAVQEDLSRAEALGRCAALLVDLAALDGAYGRPQKKTARRLLEEGLAHAVATDVHTPEDQRSVAAGMTWIRKRMGPEALDRLLAENPRHILAGELP